MKKRIIALILVFVFALPLFSAPSYAKYDEEILFRDIPWGLKHNDAVKAAKESGIDFKNELSGTSQYSKRVMLHNNLHAEVAGEKATVYLNCYNLEESLDDTIIDDFIFGKAAYKFEFDGSLWEDKKIEEKTKVLLTKLSSLYGKPDEDKTENYTDGVTLMQEQYYYWYGANDTKLTLMNNISIRRNGESYGFVYIYYESTAITEEMEALNAKDNEKEAEEEKRKAEEEKRKAEEEERKKQEEQQRKKADVSGL